MDKRTPHSTDPFAVPGLFAPAEGLLTRLRIGRALRRQDRRSALLARRHGVLGLLMSAEAVDDVVAPAVAGGHDGRPDPTARAALDVLWRTVHGPDRRTGPWNPAVLHVRQAADLRLWNRVVRAGDVAASLRTARLAAVAELDAARAGRGVPARSSAAVPSL